MFDLTEFKQTYNVRGVDVVSCLSEHYPKFTKAAESFASRPDVSGITLTADAAEILNAHFNPNRHRRRAPTDGMRQIRCRVTPEFAEKLSDMARRKGYTVQELLSSFAHDWYKAMVRADEAMEGGGKHNYFR